MVFVTILGPSAVIAAIGYANMCALGRNSSTPSKILLAMIVSLVFAEAVVIVTSLILFQLFEQ